MTETKRVVIVGAGFAGVACARRLAAEPRARVTIVDRNGYHQFQPLLYQIATAELAPRDIRFELDEMFARHSNVETHTGEVVSLDPHAPSVTLADGSTLPADVLVLGAGAQPNFFHTPGADQHTLPLYSLDDAERVRGRILELFRDAAAKPELIDEGALTFVVVGGGPTGVETAGALAEIVHDVMPHVYPHLAIAGAKVILVDLGHTVLTAFSEDAHGYAVKQLKRRGVELRLGVSVKEVTPDGVTLSDGTGIPTRLVVWGGGQMAAPSPSGPACHRGAAAGSTYARTSPSPASPGCTRSATSRTSRPATVTPCPSWAVSPSRPATGRPATSSPTSRARPGSRSTTGTRGSWR